jgi:hypothetical protein
MLSSSLRAWIGGAGGMLVGGDLSCRNCRTPGPLPAPTRTEDPQAGQIPTWLGGLDHVGEDDRGELGG